MRASLRQALNSKRLGLSAAEKIAAAETVAERILANLPSTGGYIAGYWAMAGELPLHVLQMRLPSHWIWCLPVVMAERQLRFAPWRNGDALGTNRFGIPEPMLEASSCIAPQDMQTIVLPLLGFSRTGQRLGMGGGYYDASFAFRIQQPAPPVLIGAAYALQEIQSFDSQEWDVPLDAIATEVEWIDCMKGNN